MWLLYFDIFQPVNIRGKVVQHQVHERKDLDRAIRIDFVGSVRWFVVVGM